MDEAARVLSAALSRQAAKRARPRVASDACRQEARDGGDGRPVRQDSRHPR